MPNHVTFSDEISNSGTPPYTERLKNTWQIEFCNWRQYSQTLASLNSFMFPFRVWVTGVLLYTWNRVTLDQTTIVYIWFYLNLYRKVHWTTIACYSTTALWKVQQQSGIKNPRIKFIWTVERGRFSSGILFTDHYSYAIVLMRRICEKIKNGFSLWSFPIFSTP